MPNTFDPTKFGAVPVETASQSTGFDPSKFGASPVDQQTDPAIKALDAQVKGTSGGGFLSKVQDIFKSSMQKGTKQMTKAWMSGVDHPDQSLAESALQGAGGSIGAFFSTATDITTGLANLAIPQKTKDQLANSPFVKTILPAMANMNDPITGLPMKKVVENSLMQIASWTQKHPRAARNLDAVFNVITALPGGKAAEAGIEAAAKSAGELAIKGGEVASKGLKVAKIVGKEAAPILGEAMGKGAKALEEAGRARAAAETMDIVSPKLSKLEKEAAVAAGRGTKEGLLGTVKIKPSVIDESVAKSVEGIVSKGKSAFENTNAIRQDIAASSNNLRGALEKYKGIFNNNEMTAVLNKAKEGSRVIFGTDKTLNSTYDAITNEYMRILKEKGNTLAGALDARQEFDKVIENKFPGLLGNAAGDNVRRNAVLDVRRAVNQFIESKLPEGDAMRAVLQKMTNQYTAIDNIAVKAAQTVDTNILNRALNAVKNNTVISALAGAGVVAHIPTIIAGLTNPVVLAGLFASGAYKVGKMMLTSDTVTKFLIDALKAGEKILNPEDKQAIQGLLDKFQSAASGVQKAGEDVYGKMNTLEKISPKVEGAPTPKTGIKIFHGTTEENLNAIKKEGFKLMPRTAITQRDAGDVFYFSTKESKAAKFGVAMLETEIPSSWNVLRVPVSNDFNGIKNASKALNAVKKGFGKYDAVVFEGSGQFDGLTLIRPDKKIPIK